MTFKMGPVLASKSLPSIKIMRVILKNVFGENILRRETCVVFRGKLVITKPFISEIQITNNVHRQYLKRCLVNGSMVTAAQLFVGHP